VQHYFSFKIFCRLREILLVVSVPSESANEKPEQQKPAVSLVEERHLRVRPDTETMSRKLHTLTQLISSPVATPFAQGPENRNSFTAGCHCCKQTTIAFGRETRDSSMASRWILGNSLKLTGKWKSRIDSQLNVLLRGMEIGGSRITRNRPGSRCRTGKRSDQAANHKTWRRHDPLIFHL